MSFPVFSFAAMDGVPFMISEKFSCVPESVSFMHDFPSPTAHPSAWYTGLSWWPRAPASVQSFLVARPALQPPTGLPAWEVEVGHVLLWAPSWYCP